MPASFRLLLPCGNSCSRALLRLLSGLLPGGGFGGGALLGLLGGGLLSGGGFGGGALLGLLGSGLLSGGGALLGLLGGLLASSSFGRRALLRSKIRRR